MKSFERATNRLFLSWPNSHVFMFRWKRKVKMKREILSLRKFIERSVDHGKMTRVNEPILIIYP